MDRSHSPEPKELRIILNVSFSKGISRIKQHATRDMLCAIQYDYSITVHNWKKTVKNDLMTWKDVIIDKQHSSTVSINKAEWVILLWCYSGYSSVLRSEHCVPPLLICDQINSLLFFFICVSVQKSLWSCRVWKRSLLQKRNWRSWSGNTLNWWECVFPHIWRHLQLWHSQCVCVWDDIFYPVNMIC